MTGTDLRPELLPIRDQGARPTCLSFACSAAHERLLTTQEITSDALSVEALYGFALGYLHATTAAGLSLDSVSSALRHDGQPREAQWPYGTVSASVPDPEMFRCTSETVAATDVDVLMATLRSGQLLVGGFALGQSFRRPTAGMLPDVFEPPVIGFHAMAIVGHTLTDDQRLGSFILRNSWGTGWGAEGYACMPLAHFRESCRACLRLIPS